MSSFSPSFVVGSASSARVSVRDAIQSYRRAQYLVAGSTVASSDASDLEYDDEDDEEAQRSFRLENEDSDVEDQELDATPSGEPRGRDDSFIGQLNWDEEDNESTRHASLREQTSILSDRRLRQPLSIQRLQLSGPSNVREDTPLLAKKVSFSALPRPYRTVEPGFPAKDLLPQTSVDEVSSASRRRLSTSSAASKGLHRQWGGQSTFGQTLFNSIAILLGIGMLSEPLAFAYSGWAVGTLLIISYGFVACYTAKILARIILSDPRIRSYSDIGRKAFGPKVTPFISGMFCLELFAVSVVLITLYGDSLHSLMPEYPANTFKIWGTFLLIPTVFLPLSLLSYTSILGIVSTVLLTFVILIDGISKKEAPGSLWSPAETDFGVKSFNKLGIAFGLFMAGFAGHAVIPSLARDMIDPSRFDTMINWAFVVATSIYALIGYAGYMMFGNDVSDEISLNLLSTPGYNPFLNTLCLWMLVLSPLSKFALNTQPLNTTVEILLGIDTPISSPEDLVDKPDGLSVAPGSSNFGLKRVLAILQRIFLTTLAVAVSVAVPEFSSMMAFLGSFSAFMLSIVGPVMAKVVIDGRCGWFDGTIIVSGVTMAIWGTAAAFLDA
ncbi:Vacuolar amino acid transporter 1 [Psilocybe cubensis]|uniref:Vacuolar amino acid transporter 1 n=2 Tax=Psilocybe cubensis TaxID=181762 RepID=A0ACB8HG30_PSICU|nr:Vacuolar amino acid transporter 1 [Psilocybe cubensis]KAH9486763.1 Vacuolar amino acid transporter 1 [Psilocybe cubensis]